MTMLNPTFAEVVLNADNRMATQSNVVIGMQNFAYPNVLKVIKQDLAQLNIKVTNLEQSQYNTMQYSIFGKTIEHNGVLIFQFEIQDNLTKQVLNGVQTVKTKNTVQGLRMAGHKISDRVYELLNLFVPKPSQK